MFVIRCNAGLGNRLMRMIGGYTIANCYNREAKIYWPKEYDCECTYTALFEPNSNVIDTPDLYRDCDLYITQHKHLDHYKAGTAIAYDHLHPQFNMRDYKQVGYMSSVIPDFITQNDIIKSVLKFRIKKLILHEALNFIKKYNINKEVQGLVVRLTDRHSLSTVTAAYNTIKANSETQFFVTCDSNDFYNTLSKFSNVIVYNQTAFPVTYKNGHELNAAYCQYLPLFKTSPNRRVCYRDEESIVQAFITMLILSQTTIHDPITTFESYFQKAASTLFSHIDLKRFLLNN